jgi:hypothetical protein
MKRKLQFALLFVVACSNPEKDAGINLAPPPEDRTGFTELKPRGFEINYNKEFLSAREAPLGESEIVIGVESDGQSRAYPVNFMPGPLSGVVNDHLGKKNIAVTWSPVYYCGIAYHRDIDGRPFHFGVLGMENGSVVLYDRQTRSRWNHLAGKAVSGKMVGEKLRALPTSLTTWKQWRENHPETTVYVNRSVQYEPLFSAATFREVVTRNEGKTLGSTDLVLALEGHARAKAYPLKRLIDEPILNDTFEEIPLLVTHSNDISTARIYDRRVDGRTLTFKRSWFGNKLVDTETGTEWDVSTGAAVDGELLGQTLNPIPATQVLWFAWKGYRPDTVIHGDS